MKCNIPLMKEDNFNHKKIIIVESTNDEIILTELGHTRLVKQSKSIKHPCNSYTVILSIFLDLSLFFSFLFLLWQIRVLTHVRNVYLYNFIRQQLFLFSCYVTASITNNSFHFNLCRAKIYTKLGANYFVKETIIKKSIIWPVQASNLFQSHLI